MGRAAHSGVNAGVVSCSHERRSAVSTRFGFRMGGFAWGKQQCCICGIDSMDPEVLAGMACSVGTVGRSNPAQDGLPLSGFQKSMHWPTR